MFSVAQRRAIRRLRVSLHPGSIFLRCPRVSNASYSRSTRSNPQSTTTGSILRDLERLNQVELEKSLPKSSSDGEKVKTKIGHILKSAHQFPPLPRIPPKPTSSPASVLTPDEIQLYLNPLLSRLWDVRFSADEYDSVAPEEPIWMGKQYILEGPIDAFAFARRLVALIAEENHPPVKMFVQAGTVGLHISSIRQEDPSALTLNDIRLAMLSDTIFAKEFPESSASRLKDAKRTLTERTTAFAKSWIPGSTIVAHNKLPSRPPEDDDATPLPVPSIASVTLSDDLEPINDTDIERYVMPLYSHKWLVNIAHSGTSKNLRLSKRFDFQDDEFFTSIVPFLDALTQFGSSNNPRFTLQLLDNTVYLYTHTHEPNPENNGIIAHADVREAIRLENMLQDYAVSGSLTQKEIIMMSFSRAWRPKSLAEISKKMVSVR